MSEKSFRVGLSALGLVAIAMVVLLLVRGSDRDVSGPATGDPSAAGEQSTGQQSTLAALMDLEVRLANQPIWIDVAGTRFNLVPASIGFDLDEQSVAESALAAHSPEEVIEIASSWHEGDETDLALVGTIDQEALSRVLDRYDAALDGPFEGGIVMEGTTPIPVYPRPGLVIDRSTAAQLILAALLQRPMPEVVALDTLQKLPILSVQAVDTALHEAVQLVGAPIILSRTDPDATLYLDEGRLARALLTRAEREPSPHIMVTFDPVVFDEYLHPLRAGFEAPPVDARIVIDADDNVTILPGFPGARIDTDLVVEAAMDAARRASRTNVLPLDTGVQPTISSQDLLRVKEKISEFTTHHPCCQPRVGNIQRFAAEMDGRMLLPGEVMSLNDTVGERTRERGYVPAPTIIKGEITDTVGGGVSQFATTFYNAVFWAGLEILEHQPHSYYFSRYPEGIEATISWREPDLVFRNDTDTPVVIKTSSTGTSITVKLFGDNSDREVSAWVSGRYDWTEFPTEYVPNPEMMPWDEEAEVQTGANGWSVTVTRQLDFRDGSPSTTQKWTVRYRPWPRQFEVHPCLLPEEHEEYTGEECPVNPDGPSEPGTEQHDGTTVPTEDPPDSGDGADS
ncbi:MAG: VanW family protein [bacterium]|nr:VanW family protein [bacterium]MDE0436814.1 VanW family protein [bacterium]